MADVKSEDQDEVAGSKFYMAPVAELVDELRSEVRSVASSTLSTGYLVSLRAVLVFMDKALLNSFFLSFHPFDHPLSP